MTFMYCWRSGVIEIGEKLPKGIVVLACGQRSHLEKSLVAARLADDNKTRLVPGLAEANCEAEANRATLLFTLHVHARIQRMKAWQDGNRQIKQIMSAEPRLAANNSVQGEAA